MTDGPILFCYDGSDNADRAIVVTAGLLGGRRSVVLDVGPPLTAAESLAAMSPVIPVFGVAHGAHDGLPLGTSA